MVGLIEVGVWYVYGDVDIYCMLFKVLCYMLLGCDECMLMKFVVVCDSQCVVGVYMVGCDVGEIIQGIVIVICVGVMKVQFDDMIGIYLIVVEEFVMMWQKVVDQQNGMCVCIVVCVCVVGMLNGVFQRY